MAYSTITIKKCKCGCGKYKTLGYAGYNYKCAPENIKAEVDAKTRAQKRKQRQTLQSKVRSLAPVDKEAIELELWFKVKMNLNEPRCAECGAYKPELKQWDKGWQSCQAHLLPKRHFKSIQTHPLIGMVLGSGFSGLCLCHDIYDSSWEKAAKMKMWPEVVRRFKILYPLIDQKEYQFIPQQLIDTL